MKETHLLVSSDEEKFLIEDPKLYDTTLVKIYSAVWLVKKNSRQLLSQSVAKCLLMTVFLFLLWLLNENFWYSRLFLLAVAAVFRHSSKCTCLSFIFTARCIKSLAKCKLSNTVQSSLVFTQRKESSTATGFDWKYLWHCSKFIRHLGPRRRCFWSLSTATNRNGSETSIPGKCDNNRLNNQSCIKIDCWYYIAHTYCEDKSNFMSNGCTTLISVSNVVVLVLSLGDK